MIWRDLLASVRNGLFVVSAIMALICGLALYLLGPSLTSNTLIDLSNQKHNADIALRVALEERAAQSSGDGADLDAVIASIDVTRQEMSQLPLASWYWLKFVRRGGDATHRFGTILMHAIVAVGLCALFYVVLLGFSGRIPGFGRGPSANVLLEARLESVEQLFAKTDDLQSAEEENQRCSETQQGTYISLALPLRWIEWVLPILGFVGTVVGISGAVEPLQAGVSILFVEGLSPRVLSAFNAGFSGLAVAFDTTFLGLFGLAIVGSINLAWRRHAMQTIQNVDADTRRKIALLQPRNPWEFRDWVTEEFPKVLEVLNDKTINALEELLTERFADTQSTITDSSENIRREMTRQGETIAGTVANYGEVSTRILGRQSHDLRGILTHQRFLIECVYEAASHSRDEFWVRFVEAIERPYNNQPDMTLVNPGSGTPLDALATSSAPYRIAFALQDSDTGQTKIQVIPLDELAGAEVEFVPQGIDDLSASVTQLAFSHNADVLAYALSDGTVGVYDVIRKSPGPVELLDGSLNPRCFCWTRDAEPVLLVGAMQAPVRAIRWTRTRSGGSSGGSFDIWPIALDAEFALDAIVLDPVSGRFYLGGRRGEHFVVCPALFDLSVRRLKVINDIPLTKAQGPVVDVAVLEEDPLRIIAVHEDAMICVADATKCTPLPLGGGRALLCAVDGSRQFTALAQSNADKLTLLDLPDLDGIRQIKGFSPIVQATLTPNSQLLVVAGDDGHIAYWQFPQYLVAGQE